MGSIVSTRLTCDRTSAPLLKPEVAGQDDKIERDFLFLPAEASCGEVLQVKTLFEWTKVTDAVQDRVEQTRAIPIVLLTVPVPVMEVFRKC